MAKLRLDGLPKDAGGARPGAGRKPYQPTDREREQVKALTGYGISMEEIAALIGIDRGTLADKFPNELAVGRATANARVAQRLFERATKDGDTTAMIWWTKARMRWSEKHEHEHTGAGGGPIQIVTGVSRDAES